MCDFLRIFIDFLVYVSVCRQKTHLHNVPLCNAFCFCKYTSRLNREKKSTQAGSDLAFCYSATQRGKDPSLVRTDRVVAPWQPKLLVRFPISSPAVSYLSVTGSSHPPSKALTSTLMMITTSQLSESPILANTLNKSG
jgi:hypothetical protein